MIQDLFPPLTRVNRIVPKRTFIDKLGANARMKEHFTSDVKCLKETYLHKVKMIYIDPPYNTGNDFVYEDDFSIRNEELGMRSGWRDDEGNLVVGRMQRNTESNGRFHTDWLNMIYPRLKVARDSYIAKSHFGNHINWQEARRIMNTVKILTMTLEVLGFLETFLLRTQEQILHLI